MGHPAPFHLKMIGVGNEQWGAQYIERYKLFAEALKAKYPEINLVSAAGPAPSGEQFEFLWSNWRTLNADIVDEHYYMNPAVVPHEHRTLRSLRPHRPESIRGRIRRANLRRRQA